MSSGIFTFVMRQARHSFQTMIGFWCIYFGLAGLLDFGTTANVFTEALGHLLAAIFNIGSILAGAGVFFGIGMGRGDAEGGGLILLAASLIIRSVVLGWMLPFNAQILNLYVLNASLLVACGVRLYALFSAQQLLEARENGQLGVSDHLA